MDAGFASPSGLALVLARLAYCARLPPAIEAERPESLTSVTLVLRLLTGVPVES